jgi:hypothetical protein
MPGDRGLAFVIIGGICAIGLWIGSARAIPPARKFPVAILFPTPPVPLTPPVPAPALTVNDSKTRLAITLQLTPLD